MEKDFGLNIVFLLWFQDSKYNDLLKASAIIELVHVASLVHDDVLDKAPIQKNQHYLHNDIGDHMLFSLGDALFSYALELATEFPKIIVCQELFLKQPV